MLGEVALVCIAAVIIVRILNPVKPPAPPPLVIHECSMQGHDYQPVYDEKGSEKINSVVLPTAGPFMPADAIVKMAQFNASAQVNGPRERTYVHSVCKYCGITIKRDE